MNRHILGNLIIVLVGIFMMVLGISTIAFGSVIYGGGTRAYDACNQIIFERQYFYLCLIIIIMAS